MYSVAAAHYSFEVRDHRLLNAIEKALSEFLSLPVSSDLPRFIFAENFRIMNVNDFLRTHLHCIHVCFSFDLSFLLYLELYGFHLLLQCPALFSKHFATTIRAETVELHKGNCDH